MARDDKLDEYTLNKTTYLIATLTHFVSKLTPNPEIGHLLSRGSGIYSKTMDVKNIEIPKKILETLIDHCQEIRRGIGSPDTMPKGLVIDFTMHLSQAICDATKIQNMREYDITHQFLKYLETELDKIRNDYPDLTKAGEDLQSALENSRLERENTFKIPSR